MCIYSLSSISHLILLHVYELRTNEPNDLGLPWQNENPPALYASTRKNLPSPFAWEVVDFSPLCLLRSTITAWHSDTVNEV